MAENWIVCYESSNQQEVDIIALKLEQEGIDVFVDDHSDSVYPTLGNMRILVHPHQIEKAMSIITDHGHTPQPG